MAARVVAPVSQTLKSVISKLPQKSVPENWTELKKTQGPATAAAIDQLEASLVELDKLAVVNGIDYSKPIDQFLNWDLLEKESEPYMPGLAKEIRKISLASDAVPFRPTLDAIRAPFEEKVAELMEEAVVIEETCKTISAGLKDRVKSLQAELDNIKDVTVEDFLVRYPEINKQIEKELYLHDFKSLAE
eukprot:TRINITY_DN13_c0_g1_i1.p2 TRINITY_DN13_c0_g1~~TRINITY_DN13_c0_g1_i1.p2  ORF type:complete len:212 (-),score=73.24 TRINITY_DN13_c0_g1_i1:311-877(-)